METVIKTIPVHLCQYIATQDYDLYTHTDHSVWRYIMKISQYYFQHKAHSKYLDGLNETGISTERIPKISEMDERLQKFGWRAVPITGFVPPAIFLEMLSLGILPIACDMRKLENIEYTPSPDIVHEAAGHAPIIADPSYASFLRRFGSLARKVIFAKEDCVVYEAILNLSETKEDPESSEEDIKKAQENLDEAYKTVGYVSEAQQAARLGWWSLEYGLIKEGGEFKIYGAGLLSSIGESYTCLGDEVKKIPLTIDCIKQDYDITKPQPQLFYAESFKEMESVIDDLAATMAYTNPSTESLDKAIRAETVTTTELSSGLQVGGQLVKYRVHEGLVSYLHFTGPTQLAENNKEIPGQGPLYHKEGFGTPLGKIESYDKGLDHFSFDELEKEGLLEGNSVKIKYQSGVLIEGRLIKITRFSGLNQIFSFEDCTVSLGSEVLFDPSWGTFDMACSTEAAEVFGGAPDRASYLSQVEEMTLKAKPHKTNLTEDNKAFSDLLGRLRNLRESNDITESQLVELHQDSLSVDPKNWLARWEILELSEILALDSLSDRLESELKNLAEEDSSVYDLVHRGLRLFGRGNLSPLQ
ncbi:MAG: aromatic amino acid hydroxylase [Bdellovibrionales bacterium]